MNSMRKALKIYRRIISQSDGDWLQSKSGIRFRVFLFGSTVAVYPISLILLNGPLLKLTFKWRNSVDYKLPEHLKQIVDEQYEIWLEKEKRKPNDAVKHFCLQTSTKSLDSITAGSMGVRFGMQSALPFFARFKTAEELNQFCKDKLQPFFYINKIPICIIWDSQVGEELMSTFLLSENELKFLIARDLYANDGYNAFINLPLSWATWTTFASIFTYWFHKKFTKGTVLSFLLIYIIFALSTIFGSIQWHYLYRHLNYCHSDDKSGHLSLKHSQGGLQYYFKLLKRNRILKSLLEEKGDKYISPVGDERNAITPYFTRFELLKDINVEDDELKPIMNSDVF